MRHFACLRIVILAALCAVPAAAQNLNSSLFPRFQVTAGGYGTHFSTHASLNGQTDGTDVNFERDAGLNANKSLSRFGLAWRPFTRHEFSANFFTADRSGSHVIDREIHWDDQTYPLNATVNGKLSTNFWGLNYTYWLQQSANNGFGITGGFAGMTVKAGLGIQSASGGNSASREAKATAPIPVLGIEDRYAFTPRWIAQGRITALPRVKFEGYSARSLVGAVSIEYRIVDVVAVGASYNYFDVKGTVDKTSFNGDLGVRVSGPELFLRFVLR